MALGSLLGNFGLDTQFLFFVLVWLSPVRNIYHLGQVFFKLVMPKVWP